MDADREEFLTALRESLRAYLWNRNEKVNPGLRMESLDFEGMYPATEAVIVFKDERRPGCRFGYRWGPLWEWVEEDGETPGSLSTIIWANFDEARALRLPPDCDPEAINWFC